MLQFVPFPQNYELIDAGGGRKLEKWGEIITIRPEHQAYFSSVKPFKEWQNLAHWEFVPVAEGQLNGKWKKLNPQAPDSWKFGSEYGDFHLEVTSNKHIGIFPEQAHNWAFISDFLTPEKRFLNAFAYTGVASIVGKQTGAEVIHVDSMRGMLDWGNRNQELNQLHGIKWVLEDALKFIRREHKRGNQYELIQLDPPAWGLGAKNEKWKIEDLLPQLLEEAISCLKPNGTLILNTYSPKVTEQSLSSILNTMDGIKDQTIDELWMTSTTGKKLFFGQCMRLVKA